MKILSRYIVLRHFIPFLGLTLSAFTGLYLIVDFFEKVDDFLEKKVPTLDTTIYFLYKIPFMMNQGIPIAALLATLVTLGILKRNREIVALKAAGIAPIRYAGPIALTVLLIAVAQFGFGETVVRYTNKQADTIWRQQVKKKKASASWIRENIWYRGNNTIFQIRLYDHSKQTLEKVSVFYFDSDFRLTQRLDARRFRWDGNGWIAEDGLVLKFSEGSTQQEVFDSKKLDLPETPNDFSSMETIPEELNWFELHGFTERVRKEGYNATPYEVELHTRAASSVTTIILVALGITLTLRQGLHTGMVLSAGTALVAASVYLVVLQLGTGLAMAEILPPSIGVWSGNIIFAALALYLWIMNDE